MYHNPVLLEESVAGLFIQPGGIYIDVTFGGGGHSREILKRLKSGRLISFDKDMDAGSNIIDDPRFIFINANFILLRNFLKFYNALPADGILADLGVSSHQFDQPERGFSIRFDAALDLRMDRNQQKDGRLVINSYNENDLSKLFRQYGEIGPSVRLAKEIVVQRQKKEITTTGELADIARKFTSKGNEMQFLAKVFQAIRIEVNDELENLKTFLMNASAVLKPGGRLVVISYHSLEDRLVKNYIRTGNFEGEPEKDFYGNVRLVFKQVTKKPVIPSAGEIKKNSRARSAKLRIAEKL